MRFFILFFSFVFLFAYRIDLYKWSKRDTFYNFLKVNHLPFSIYYRLPPKIKKKVSHIPIGSEVFILQDNNKIKQLLIPLDSKNQLQIIKTSNNHFDTKIIPITYTTKDIRFKVYIKNYLSYDVYQTTKLKTLANRIYHIFQDRIDFNKLPKETVFEIILKEKIRYGKVKDYKILYASIENRFYKIDAFLNPKDNKYYDSYGRSLRGMFLKAPLVYKRISSKFGMRYHPILHKWLMHDGIDYVNKIGTPIHTVADGVIIYKGWIKGYGKSVKIKHRNGYITLYAHLHSFPKGLYIGKRVYQGQTIGYLGNTGLSTGPHLHFGVMHYRKWINPEKLKYQTKVVLRNKARKEFLAYIQQFTNRYNLALK